MPKLNENYLNLKESYLFAEINHRVKAYQEANPDKKSSVLESAMLPCPSAPK